MCTSTSISLPSTVSHSARSALHGIFIYLWYYLFITGSFRVCCPYAILSLLEVWGLMGGYKFPQITTLQLFLKSQTTTTDPGGYWGGKSQEQDKPYVSVNGGHRFLTLEGLWFNGLRKGFREPSLLLGLPASLCMVHFILAYGWRHSSLYYALAVRM